MAALLKEEFLKAVRSLLLQRKNEKRVTFFTLRSVLFEFFNCGKNRQAEELGTTVAGLRFSWCCFHLIKIQRFVIYD